MKRLAVVGLGLALAAFLAGCSGGGSDCRTCGDHPSGVKTQQPEPYPPPVSPGGASPTFECPHDHATRSTAGPCPHCGMLLDERYRKVN